MTKSELIAALSIKENLPVTIASEVVNLIFNCFTDTIKKGGRVELRGFGVFTVREYDAHAGRNPRSGEKIPVRAKKLPFFKVGKELKERVNGD